MPRAAGFLWNPRMMLQVTCRGYAVAQFMQPEPAKYAYAPTSRPRPSCSRSSPITLTIPGRFFYVKDEDTGELFSAPYEPVRAKLDRFSFSVGKSDIRWSLELERHRVGPHPRPGRCGRRRALDRASPQRLGPPAKS